MTKPANPFRYFNSSPQVIRKVVTMYVKFPLSLRNVEDLLAERGIKPHQPRSVPGETHRRTGRVAVSHVGVDGPRRHRTCQTEVVADLRQRRPSVEQISRIGMD